MIKNNDEKMKNEKKQKRCSICKERKIDSEKNNAEPIITNGRCCDNCNSDVILARIISHYRTKI